MMMEAPELKESIAEAVHEFASKKQAEGVKSLSRMNPEKVGLILYLFCLGVSQSQMVKKYGFCHKTIKHTLMEYADHLGQWTEVGARLSKQLFLNLHSLEEDIIEEVRERMESGKLKATFRDIGDVGGHHDLRRFPAGLLQMWNLDRSRCADYERRRKFQFQFNGLCCE